MSPMLLMNINEVHISIYKKLAYIFSGLSDLHQIWTFDIHQNEDHQVKGNIMLT